MARASAINRHAVATRIAQRLAGPAEAILGFQEMVIDELRRSGPADAIDDAERVLAAAQDLSTMIAGLLSPEMDAAVAELDDATLRHDLRTPVTAILGYSELVREDFAGQLGATVEKDINRIVSECGRLLDQLDALLEYSHGNKEETGEEDSDIGIAEALERTLARVSKAETEEAGRILVIDDMEANRELLKRALERRGHLVTAVGSARTALQSLEDNPFDLALVDILMPDMNGIELLKRLKEDQRWRDMPVVMVSGLKDVEAVVKCIAVGAEDYLQKPIDAVLLHARVDACLERARLRAREKEYLRRINYEKDRADGLLLAMLPAPVIQRLGEGETIIADRFDNVTIVFADIVDFTPLVARTEPATLVEQLHDLFSAFDDLADRHGIEKIKTIGDAYMAAAGVPHPRTDHAQCALEFARDMIATMAEGKASGMALKLRIGLSSGPVIAGLIGRKRFLYDVWGETVNLASRMEASGQAGRIHISQSTFDALNERSLKLRPQELVLKGVGRTRSFIID